MLLESNNLINANNTPIASQGIRSIVLDGNISPENQIDLYQFQIDAGEGITIDIDTNELDSDLDSVLRLFDGDGNELASNDDTPAPGEVFSFDSYLTFIANTTGDYYLGVSSVFNMEYNPLEIDSNNNTVEDNISSNYQLDINLVEIVPEVDPDDTIGEAISTELNAPGSSIILSDEIDVGRDIDIYQVRLNEGDGLIADIDAAEFDSSLDSQLRLFDSDGNELASHDDTPTLDGRFNTDSYLAYTAQADGEYYIGVSAAENAGYDAIYGRTNLLQNESTNSGTYDLKIDIIEIEVDRDPDNTISEANIIELADPQEQNAIAIQDSINPQGDVDIFSLSLDAGKTISLNINAAKLNETLDSALLLFDESGNELVSNDDGAAPGENLATIDSYLEFTPDVAGIYYVGVSGFPNIEYDVVNGRDNLAFDRDIFSIGDYELIINSLDNREGTSESDTLFGHSHSTLIRGLPGNDTITGRGNNDYLLGDSGNDLIKGNNGDDTLVGGTGVDSLSGGAGADILQGDNGNNLLRGGSGADIFVLNKTNTTEDRIVDFEDGIDKILLGDGSNFADLILENFTSGVGVTILTSDNIAISQIAGIQSDDLSEDDFILRVNENEIG